MHTFYITVPPTWYVKFMYAYDFTLTIGVDCVLCDVLMISVVISTTKINAAMQLQHCCDYINTYV